MYGWQANQQFIPVKVFNQLISLLQALPFFCWTFQSHQSKIQGHRCLYDQQTEALNITSSKKHLFIFQIFHSDALPRSDPSYRWSHFKFSLLFGFPFSLSWTLPSITGSFILRLLLLFVYSANVPSHQFTQLCLPQTSISFCVRWFSTFFQCLCHGFEFWMESLIIIFDVFPSSVFYFTLSFLPFFLWLA